LADRPRLLGGKLHLGVVEAREDDILDVERLLLDHEVAASRAHGGLTGSAGAGEGVNHQVVGLRAGAHDAPSVP
jgi:hypothetical protein